MSNDNNLSDEDLALWYYVSQSIEPIKGREAFHLPEKAKTNKHESKSNPISSEELERLVEQNISYKKSKPQLDYIRHGTMSGVDKSTAKKLTGGKFSIDAKLDLHGKTQDEALNSLRNFIRNSYEAGKRNVLVITGKGANNDGILKNQVPRWLNSDGLRENIIMFSYAKPKHGGDGALYVLLRKKKDYL
jgi:DNA-nicking Smr family endonuclease